MILIIGGSFITSIIIFILGYTALGLWELSITDFISDVLAGTILLSIGIPLTFWLCKLWIHIVLNVF